MVPLRAPSRIRLFISDLRRVLAVGFLRDLDVAHQDHVFHTAKAFAWAVGVQRTHGAVVAGVHGGEEVETLRATNFAQA